MVQVICPVCGALLTTEKPAWRCEKGHCFDVARQGYVNLLTVQQKHSLHPGDTAEMVLARRPAEPWKHNYVMYGARTLTAISHSFGATAVIRL